MRRKEILSLKPTRPKTEGKVFTVQSLERILIMNYWEDEKLIGRYCLNTKSGESMHPIWYRAVRGVSVSWKACVQEIALAGRAGLSTFLFTARKMNSLPPGCCL